MRLRHLPWLALSAAAAVLAATAADAASTRKVVTCLNAAGTPARVVKPKACTFVLKTGNDVGAARVTVTKLKWKGWGTATATGTGTFMGNMGSSGKGAVRLSRLKACRGGATKAYTRMSVRPAGQSKATVVDLAGCP
ncbi:hypothetical protein [Baekduia sp. Peel2402]|uniref:hypothetical protein n=1 Tax=Baekduia sp. Peel2402 TaxID=3458296 RepID=UPI00403EEE6A